MGRTVDIEEVLGDGQWLRTLAIALAGDEAAAADAVQETYLAALRHPPPANRPLRAWLTVVLRNALRMQRRSETRRAGRETDFGSLYETTSDDPEKMLGRLELQAKLAEVVLGLGEPYRSAVLRRYYAGETSQQIAKSLGVPAGTIRWRLKRGLELVRCELDRMAGGRGNWMAMLVPLVPVKASTAAGGAGAAVGGGATVGGGASVAGGTTVTVTSAAGTTGLVGATATAAKASLVGLGWAKVAVAAGAIGAATVGAASWSSSEPPVAPSARSEASPRGIPAAGSAQKRVAPAPEEENDAVLVPSVELEPTLQDPPASPGEPRTAAASAVPKQRAHRPAVEPAATASPSADSADGDAANPENSAGEELGKGARKQVVEELVDLAESGGTLDLESNWDDSDFLIP